MSSKLSHRTSLGLNVVLAAAAVMLVLRGSNSAPESHAIEVGPAVATSQRTVSRQFKLPEYPERATASDRRRWLVDHLRAMGVPNHVLARIVLEDLDWAWNIRGGELSLQCHGDPDTIAAFKLENAMSLDAEMRLALGEEGFKQWDLENMLREANHGKVPLTAAETEATYGLWKRLQQRGLEVRRARVNGEMDDADISDAYTQANAEFEQEMKLLLGEERYAKTQGMDDATASSLRQELAQMDSTDSRFQALLYSQRQWNAQRAALDKQFEDDRSSAAYAEQVKAMNAVREQEYRRVLGDQTFDTLQKQQDPGYNQMKKFEKLWGLDDNSIDSVYGMMKFYQQSVDEYQARALALEAQGQQVDWDGVNRNLEKFADETEQSLQNYLGQDRFRRMAENGAFEFSLPDMTGHGKPAH